MVNTFAGHTVKFNIINYSKPDNLFNYGMKVSVFSEKRQLEDQVNWFRSGEDISYYKNGINKTNIPWGEQYYTLSFTYTF